eukprot:715512-Rhodomonas_salina.1
MVAFWFDKARVATAQHAIPQGSFAPFAVMATQVHKDVPWRLNTWNLRRVLSRVQNEFDCRLQGKRARCREMERI